MKHIHQSQHGFHLLELLITIAIIGILASISLPLYSQHVVKVRRLEAAVALNQLALAMEKFQIEHGSYQRVTLSGLQFPETTAQERYRLRIETVSGNDYTLVAEPLGKQASDDALCGELRLDGEGRKTVSGTAEVEECF